MTGLAEVDIREQVVWENERRDPRSTNSKVYAAKHLFKDDPPGNCDPNSDPQERSKVVIDEVCLSG